MREKKKEEKEGLFEKEIKLENFFLSPSIRTISLNTPAFSSDKFLDDKGPLIESIIYGEQIINRSADYNLDLIDLKRKLEKINLHPLAIKTLLAQKRFQIPSFRQAYISLGLSKANYWAAKQDFYRKSDLI